MNSDSIRLHQEKGVNPRMTVCENCGKDVGLALLGAHDATFKCTTIDCRQLHVGAPEGGKCGRCGGTVERHGTLPEHAKLPMGLCTDCEEVLNKVADAVKEGGIHWKCKDCGSAGAIHAGSGLAVFIREKSGIQGKQHFSCPDCQHLWDVQAVASESGPQVEGTSACPNCGEQGDKTHVAFEPVGFEFEKGAGGPPCPVCTKEA